nr:hypothetical protein [Parerythrobacter lutipelagi]
MKLRIGIGVAELFLSNASMPLSAQPMDGIPMSGPDDRRFKA